ncbi:FAD-dependent oxidoreductase [Azotobacter chroococcum]|uniref:FAD-dependent oxidoreductase n=1 Tax=Azotobacter chroococcum TaxID=353 RepID=UPI000B614768|nr:FAD-dependent oxidoreductase [Azotobacter chroococcum]ASL27952.1 FAD-binding dehydrogenase [Azotobacter chroococcum]
MRTTLQEIQDGESFDIVVVGAGGAGMSAALFGALQGAKVLLLEKTEYVGGTTAFSAGTTWIPGSHHAAGIGVHDDSPAKAGGYLDLAVGERSRAELRRVFLENGPKAVRAIETGTSVRYRARPLHPDYISDLEGSTLRGRALEPLPFDGRLLGERFRLIRPPIPEFTVLGGMMIDRDDVNHLLRLTRSFASFRHGVRLLARHALDRLRHPRGTRLVMGNALIASLLHSLDARDVPVLTECRLERLQRGTAGIEALEVSQKGVKRRIVVKGGVILASGGFNRHPERRRALLPGSDPQWCPGAPGHTGQAHDLAEAVGARYGAPGLSHAFWAPVSIRRRADGSTAAFPHFILDRGKPGMITVDRDGKRFLNESTSYHLFGLGMREAGVAPAYLVTDAEGLRKYGLGMVRPGGKGLKPFLADGYLTAGATLAELAGRLGIDAAGLQDSVRRINDYARSGVDLDYRRGTTDYQRVNGDAAQQPNPNLGSIGTAPFYAVRLYPGDIGAATGFATDTDARVLDKDDAPIDGLYAVGNDMHSIMGGTYPGPGITLGPGLTFAYLAAQHAVARAKAPLAREEAKSAAV